MSLILDALNRSRRDADAVPGIDTQHVVPAPEPTPAARRLLPWIALGLALLVIAWLLLDRGQSGQDAPSAPVTEVSENLGSALTSVSDELRARAQEGVQAAEPGPGPSEPPPEPAPAKADVAPPPPARDEVTPQAPAPARDTAVEQLYQQAQAAPPVVEPEPRPSPTAEEQAAAAPRPEPRPKPETAPETAPGDEEEPIDLEQMLLQARDEMANARLVDHPAPFLASLSQQTKNAIPTVLYQRHDYSSDASQSTVTLNGKTLRNGGSTGGLKVDEILPDSVVLTHRGTQFRLRALNSWVNL